MPTPDSATPAVRRAQSAIIGMRSEQQDDSRFVDVAIGDQRATLMIMADGMGGATGGALASRLAVEAATADFAASPGELPVRLQSALDAANKAITDAVDADPALSGMGTTMILATVTGRTLTWVSVGDSLLFGVRGGRLERINADHSLAAVLDEAARAGKISAEEAATSPQRNMLRSALTGGPIALIDAGERTLAPGTRLVAASDGILTLSFDYIASLIGEAADVEVGLRNVVVAVEHDMPGDQDNLTMLAVEIRAASGGKSRRVSPWLLGTFVLGVLTLIGALLALLVLWPQPSAQPRVAAKAEPAPVEANAQDPVNIDPATPEGTPKRTKLDKEFGGPPPAPARETAKPKPAPTPAAKPIAKPTVAAKPVEKPVAKPSEKPAATEKPPTNP